MKKLFSLLIITSTLLFAQTQEEILRQAVAQEATKFQQKIDQAKKDIDSMSFESKIKWVKDFQTAITQAQKEHKPIIFIASKHECKYCKMLKETTLKDNQVIKMINKNFIPLNLYLDEETSFVPYMVAVYTKGFPTIWFLDPHAKALFQPIGGYIGSKTMIQALDMVTQVYNEAEKKGK